MHTYFFYFVSVFVVTVPHKTAVVMLLLWGGHSNLLWTVRVGRRACETRTYTCVSIALTRRLDCSARLRDRDFRSTRKRIASTRSSSDCSQGERSLYVVFTGHEIGLHSLGNHSHLIPSPVCCEHLIFSGTHPQSQSSYPSFSMSAYLSPLRP